MRPVLILLILGAAACAPAVAPVSPAARLALASAAPPPTGSDMASSFATQQESRAEHGNTAVAPSRTERDARTRHEAILAARSGQPLQPIIQRHAEENVRDGVAVVPVGRNGAAQALHSERARLMDLAMAAITAMNARSTAALAADMEYMRRNNYCRSLAADINIAGSNTADITLRVLGVPSSRENSLYWSCMAGFSRTDAYLGR